MKILLLGASGKTGAQVLKAAVAAAHDVTALLRDTSALAGVDGVKFVKGDCTRESDVDAALGAIAGGGGGGCDAVIACIGARTLRANTVRSDTVRAATAAMKKHGVKKIVWLSACGVGDSAAQAKKASFVFGYVIMPLILRANYADAAVAEEALRGSGLTHVIARPVGLNDEAAKNNTVAVAVAEKPARAYISRADVAAWMLARAGDGAADNRSMTLY